MDRLLQTVSFWSGWKLNGGKEKAMSIELLCRFMEWMEVKPDSFVLFKYVFLYKMSMYF